MGQFKYVISKMAFFVPFTLSVLLHHILRNKRKENFLYVQRIAASAYHVISKEVENHIMDTTAFLDTHVCVNDPYWKSSEIIFVQILYSYLSYTDRLVDVFLVACCNIIRACWETKKKKLSFRKKYIKNFLWETSRFSLHVLLPIPAGIYPLKVNNRNTRTRCEICSKLTINTPERRHWRRSGVFIVNFEHISHLVLVFLLLTLNK